MTQRTLSMSRLARLGCSLQCWLARRRGHHERCFHHDDLAVHGICLHCHEAR